jgi:dihydrolipoamide dehydrogenase
VAGAQASHEAVICVEKIAGLPDVHPLNTRNIPAHLLHAAGGERRPVRGQGEGGGLRGQGRALPFMGNGKAIALANPTA